MTALRPSVEERLAIQGGRPVREGLLPYGHQAIDEADIEAVVRVLRSKWLTTGPNVEAFERAFADCVGAKYAVAVSSGTAALHAAAFAAGIGPDTEAITTPLTFAATANAVRYMGGRVRFADVRQDSLTLDPAAIVSMMTTKVRAIIAVDYAGQPADMDEIQRQAARAGCVVIEDAAHALGATYKGRTVGSLAHLTTFSLHPVKHITTGEGGMVCTDDAELAERMRRFRNHGMVSDHRQREALGSWFYEMEDLGYNYRLTDIQCALGLSQLSKLPEWVARRRAIAAQYDAALAELETIQRPWTLPDRESAWHLYPIRLNLERFRVGREEVFKALRAENIGVNVHYIPVPWHPYYRRLGYQKGQWPVAESAYERLLSLPIWPGMGDVDVEDTIAAVRKVVAAYRK